jgi:glycosyltransferase involved in cell wall biosynthesis
MVAARDDESRISGTFDAIRSELETADLTFRPIIAEREGEIARLSGEVTELHARLNAVFRSTSWKISAPIRGMKYSIVWAAKVMRRELKVSYRAFAFRLIRKLRARRIARTISKSGLFDAALYLERNPDVARAGVNPLLHYIEHGAAEERGPDYTEPEHPIAHPPSKSADKPLISKHNLRRTIAYYQARGLTATCRKVLQKLRSSPSLTSPDAPGHEVRRGRQAEPGHYHLARTLLATGAMNRCWYGGMQVDVISERLRDTEAYKLARGICDDIDRHDTSTILDYLETRAAGEQHKSHARGQPGGGPSLDVMALGPVEDIETYLGTVQPSARSRRVTAEPSFTIVTPYCKHREYFTACVHSVLDLVRSAGSLAIEWVVINDDPELTTNDLAKVIPDALKPYVTILSDGKNLGVSKRLNQAILLAKYEWILFLDCDDLIEAEAANTLAAYIRRFPQCRYISSTMVDIDEAGSVLRYRRRVDGPSRLLSKGMIAGHLKAVRRDLFDEYGLLDESVDGCQDYEFALRVAFNEPLLFIPEYLYFYRWHTLSQSVSVSYRQTATADAIVKKYMAKFVAEAVARTPGSSPITVHSSPKSAASEGSNPVGRPTVRPPLDHSGVAIMRTQGERIDLLSEALHSLASQGIPIDAIVVVHGDQSALSAVSELCTGIQSKIEVLHAPETQRRRGYPINVALTHLYESKREFGFLFFLDDDDVVYPMFATKMLEALAVSDADLVYAASNKRVPWEPTEPGRAPLPAACLLVGNFIPINSYCVRFTSLRAAKPFFDESLDYLEDWHFLIELLGHRFRFMAIGDTLSEFRIIGDGNTEIKRFLKVWARREDKAPANIDRVCLKLGRFYLYSQLLGFNFASRDELSESDRELVSATKALIDEKCPAQEVPFMRA